MPGAADQILRLLVCGLALPLCACVMDERAAPEANDRDGALVAALRDEASLPRRWAPRLSVRVTFAPCGRWSGASPNAVELRDLACAPHALSREALATAGRAATALRAGFDADAVHAAALIDLAAGDTAGNLHGRTISSLEMVTRLAPHPASAYADLSAAFLARASTRGDARDVAAALDAATRATELAPRHLAGRYNRALALDLLGLDAAAADAWRAYLREDSVSGWAHEARRRAARVTSRRAPRPPGPDARLEALVAYADSAPEGAWALGWERVLADWGEATLAGDTARAARRLDAAEGIARALRARGDASLGDATRAVRAAAPSRGRTRRLAAGHVRYARARARADANDPAAADSLLQLVLADRAVTGALRSAALLAHANALIYRRRPDDAERMVVALVDGIDRARHPGLVARALWSLGVLRLRHGRHDAGLAAIQEAAALFERLGAHEYQAAMTGIAGEVQLLMGDDARGFAGLQRAAAVLRATPTSPWRHAVLYLLARATNTLGYRRAAAAIEEEDAVAAAAAGDTAIIVESRLERARALWDAGQTERARPVTDAAERLVRAMPPGDVRARFEAELALTLATGPLRAQPVRARALLDSVVAFFAPLRNPAKLLPALVARADAELALGRVDAAAAELDRVAALYERQRDEIASPTQRLALLAQARAVFERLALLRLRAGDTLAALHALDRARASLAATPSPASTRRDAAVRVGYAVAGDTLLAWAVDSGRATLVRGVVPRDTLVRAVERTRAAMERDAPVPALQADLARLYEWLVRPVEARLGARGGLLAVELDDEIADVPFAALYDARRGEYLVERHAIRMAAALGGARRTPDPRPASNVALFVSDPALDWRTFPALTPLPAAAGEVRAAAGAYARPRQLAGAGADSARVAAALREADVFHFAGHAVFDDARPEHSYLAVAPRGLSAAAIGGMDLRRVRLVVLSACETMRSPERRTGGFAGLTEAFLAAGAGGVVGSVWRVDDAPTAALLVAFHRAYGGSGDAARALRDAQLALLRSPDPALRSPAAWAAFRYAAR